MVFLIPLFCTFKESFSIISCALGINTRLSVVDHSFKQEIEHTHTHVIQDQHESGSQYSSYRLVCINTPADAGICRLPRGLLFASAPHTSLSESWLLLWRRCSVVDGPTDCVWGCNPIRTRVIKRHLI